MEVCGGHTVTIHKYGIEELLPGNIRLISGPGCPVCVTTNDYIDRAIALARQPEITMASFGDMMRVPGSHSSLLKEKANGADVHIFYSPQEALDYAREHPQRETVFLGVGFETTAPAVAATILAARELSLRNFSVLVSHKTMPRAMKALLDAGELALDGFVCPGHVSSITGLGIYAFLANDYQIPCVVSGFEPLDMLESIYRLIRQVCEGRAVVENQYTRAVKPEGNRRAQELMNSVFEEADERWRGLGLIPGSGLRIRETYAEFDAARRFDIDVPPSREHPGCICGDIMRGVKLPTDCPLFAKICHPGDPQGACMVSQEGSCATFYQYKKESAT